MSAATTPEVDPGLHEIRFVANPIQHKFITSRKQADLFSSRMGEGKSAGLVFSCFHHTRHNPGATWLFIRDTWENMRETTQTEFFKWFPPGVMGEYKVSTKTFTWKVEEMRGKVVFAGMDDPKDASKLQSRQLGGCAIDEPAPAANTGGIDEMIFDTVLTRMRQPAMKWYPCKLAQNNSDETHWTYKRFVKPGDPEFGNFQTQRPENMAHLPPSYYDRVAHALRHRPDLFKRFVEGGYGFTQIGKAVTPQWDDRLHLSQGLKMIPRTELFLLWDFGLDPTCIITQITPTGRWNLLECCMDEDNDIGVHQLIETRVLPVMAQRYDTASQVTHIGDPAGGMREQSDSEQNAVKRIRKMIPGRWRPGPMSIPARVDPLNAVLARHEGGLGIIRVDEDRCRQVHHALRGGWSYKVTGDVVSTSPIKNRHSHPGDATGYGAAILFPQGDRKSKKTRFKNPGQAKYNLGKSFIGGKAALGKKIPKEMRKPKVLR